MKNLLSFDEYCKETGIYEQENSWSQDFYDLKSSLRKQFKAKPNDEITIEAAKQIAKIYKIKFQEILKTIQPDNNISGAKSWDKTGNIIKVK